MKFSLSAANSGYREKRKISCTSADTELKNGGRNEGGVDHESAIGDDLCGIDGTYERSQKNATEVVMADHKSSESIIGDATTCHDECNSSALAYNTKKKKRNRGGDQQGGKFGDRDHGGDKSSKSNYKLTRKQRQRVRRLNKGIIPSS